MKLYGVKAKHYDSNTILYLAIIHRDNDIWINSCVRPKCPEYAGTYLKFQYKRSVAFGGRNLYVAGKCYAEEVVAYLNDPEGRFGMYPMIGKHMVAYDSSLNLVKFGTAEIFEIDLKI